MTTPEGPVREQVQAKVIGAGSDARRENLIKLEIPAWQVGADKPMEIGFVPSEEIAKVKAGQWYTVTLQRGKLKTNPRTKEPLSGSRKTNHFWDVVSIGDPIAEEVTKEQAKGVEADAKFEEREQRIMRSTALAQAVAFGSYPSLQPEFPKVENLLVIAEAFYAWIRDGSQEALDVASPPDVPVGTPTSAKASPAKEAPAPSGVVIGGAAVWPGVEPEEQDQLITQEDWDKIGGIVDRLGIPRPVFSQWIRKNWGLGYRQQARRADLAAMVAWLEAHGNPPASVGS